MHQKLEIMRKIQEIFPRKVAEWLACGLAGRKKNTQHTHTHTHTLCLTAFSLLHNWCTSTSVALKTALLLKCSNHTKRRTGNGYSFPPSATSLVWFLQWNAFICVRLLFDALVQWLIFIVPLFFHVLFLLSCHHFLLLSLLTVYCAGLGSDVSFLFRFWLYSIHK